MHTKPFDAAFSAVFFNLDKCQLEAAGDVISGTALDHVGTDVHDSFGDYS